METECSFPCTQRPATDPYIDPDEYSSQGFIPIPLPLAFNLILSYCVLSKLQRRVFSFSYQISIGTYLPSFIPRIIFGGQNKPVNPLLRCFLQPHLP